MESERRRLELEKEKLDREREKLLEEKKWERGQEVTGEELKSSDLKMRLLCIFLQQNQMK